MQYSFSTQVSIATVWTSEEAHAGRCARGELVPHSCSRFRTFRSVVAVVVERPDGKPELKMMFGNSDA